MQSAARSSVAAQLVDTLHHLALESFGNFEMAQARALVAALSSGPLGAAVSVHVVHRLLTAPTEPHWLFLSYQQTAPSAVVIGGDPRECAWLHTRIPALGCAPDNYKRSLLAMEVMKNLVTTLLGTADYSGGEAAATLVCLHVLKLITLDAETLRTYTESADQPLRLLRARNTNGADHVIRAAYNAAHYVIDRPTRFTPPAEMSDDVVDAVRESIGVVARAVAAGFVHLSELDQYRSPDKHNPGFIGKPALLSRLLLPSRHVLIDVPQHEREAKAVLSVMRC